MIFNSVVLLVALLISAISAFYSVTGLTIIFAASYWPVMIMGWALELGKVTTVAWLHNYWDRAGWKLKIYLVPAVVLLMFITSMGTYGYLAKAHSDQTLVGGNVAAKISVYDEKINIAKGNIDANRRALQQMDAQVDQLLSRTADDIGANRAVQVRRQQKAERDRLQAEIATEQETITKLNEEAAPIRAEIRKVEAEVGPIKYIAAMIYGDNPDTNLLERAVRWVIVLIVFVFDPLALMLVIAAQSGLRWHKEDLRKRKKEEDIEVGVNVTEATPLNNIFDNVAEPNLKQMSNDSNDTLYKIKETENDGPVLQSDTVELDDLTGDDVHNEHLSEAPKPIDMPKPKETTVIENPKLKPEKEIKTDGTTIQETDGGYVLHQGKSIAKDALLSMYPERFAVKPNAEQENINFGSAFPQFAKKGDMFVRVDVLPNRVFKFDGSLWFEVNKNQTESYLYDEAYLHYLINKIATGEYDVELLSDSEKLEIEKYLQSQP